MRELAQEDLGGKLLQDGEVGKEKRKRRGPARYRRWKKDLVLGNNGELNRMNYFRQEYFDSYEKGEKRAREDRTIESGKRQKKLAGEKQRREEMERKLRIRGQTQRVVRAFSNNINGGLLRPDKVNQLASWMRYEKPAVLMLQETHMSAEEGDEAIFQACLDKEAPGYTLFSAACADMRQRGVAVIMDSKLVPLVRKDRVIRDVQGRYIAVPCRSLVKGQTIWWISIYAPAESKEKEGFYHKELKKLGEEMLESASARDIVLIGMDANAVINPVWDIAWEEYAAAQLEDRMRVLKREASYLNKWVEEMDLTEIWQRCYLNKRMFTRELPIKRGSEKRQNWVSRKKGRWRPNG